MSKKNKNQFLTGVLVGAAAVYFLTRQRRTTVVLPTDTPTPATLPDSIGRQDQYNPFHYLPGDLGRQLPAIYAL